MLCNKGNMVHLEVIIPYLNASCFNTGTITLNSVHQHNLCKLPTTMNQPPPNPSLHTLFHIPIPLLLQSSLPLLRSDAMSILRLNLLVSEMDVLVHLMSLQLERRSGLNKGCLDRLVPVGGEKKGVRGGDVSLEYYARVGMCVGVLCERVVDWLM